MKKEKNEWLFYSMLCLIISVARRRKKGLKEKMEKDRAGKNPDGQNTEHQC